MRVSSWLWFRPLTPTVRSYICEVEGAGVVDTDRVYRSRPGSFAGTS
jgi:hypothetical protein